MTMFVLYKIVFKLTFLNMHFIFQMHWYDMA